MRGRKFKVFKMVIAFLLIFLMSNLTYTNIIGNVKAATPLPNPDANVLLLSNTTTGALTTSLGLDDKIHTEVFANGVNTSADLHAINFSKIDVIIIDSYLPNNMSDLDYLMKNINGTLARTGVIFFGGNYTKDSITDFSTLLPIQFVIYKDLLNQTLGEYFNQQSGVPIDPNRYYLDEVYNNTNPYEIETNEIQIAASEYEQSLPSDEKSMYVTRIAWQSCPLLYNRILTYASRPDATTLVNVPNTKEPIVTEWNYGGNQTDPIKIIYISPGVCTLYSIINGQYQLTQWNKPFALWPYFNYLMYVMVYDIKGLAPSQIDTYSQWPWSPIPHAQEKAVWMIFVAALWVFNFVLFFSLGKKRKKNKAAKEAAQEAAKTDNIQTQTQSKDIKNK